MSMQNYTRTVAESQAMPTLQQAMVAALGHVQATLERLMRACHEDDEWDDKDDNVDFAMELALAHIRRMRAELPLDRSTFESSWRMAGAVISLGVRSFSRPDSMYCHWLRSAYRQFEVLVEMVEFVESAGRGPWDDGKAVCLADGAHTGVHGAIKNGGAA